MAENEQALAITSDDLRAAGLPDNMPMAPGLAVFFNENLYQRCKAVALRMSEANGIIGPHLIGKPSACMAILSRSIGWNLDPFAVAQATYEVGGKIGYEGKLVQAILENSGSIVGRVEFTFFGDWDKLRGKFKMVDAGQNKGKKPVQTWTEPDEEGLGVTVSATVKGELEPRSEDFYLAEMYPRNSTLWILRPKQQIRYAAVRAFAAIAVPGVIMGIPFDIDPAGLAGEGMRDISPARPSRTEFESVRDNPALQEWIAKANFARTVNEVGTIRAEGLKVLPPESFPQFEDVCDARARQIAANPPAEVKPEGEGDAPQAEGDVAQAEPEADAPAPFTHTGAADPEAGAKENPAEEKKPAAEPDKETPLQRGCRLMMVCKTPGDMVDLYATIADELNGKALATWKGTAQARYSELGGKGKMQV